MAQAFPLLRIILGRCSTFKWLSLTDLNWKCGYRALVHIGAYLLIAGQLVIDNVITILLIMHSRHFRFRRFIQRVRFVGILDLSAVQDTNSYWEIVLSTTSLLQMLPTTSKSNLGYSKKKNAAFCYPLYSAAERRLKSQNEGTQPDRRWMQV
jgi:hypothetical protein